MVKKGKKTKKVAEVSTIPVTPEKLEEEILIRAREIYFARGDTDGDALSDWLQAEKEIKKKYKIN